MPCHHKLEAYPDKYIKAAEIEEERKEPLFRAALGLTGQFSSRALLRKSCLSRKEKNSSAGPVLASVSSAPFSVRACGSTQKALAALSVFVFET